MNKYCISHIFPTPGKTIGVGNFNGAHFHLGLIFHFSRQNRPAITLIIQRNEWMIFHSIFCSSISVSFFKYHSSSASNFDLCSIFSLFITLLYTQLLIISQSQNANSMLSNTFKTMPYILLYYWTNTNNLLVNPFRSKQHFFPFISDVIKIHSMVFISEKLQKI